MAEWLFLGRQLPNMRSTFCLLLMLGASVGYTLTDSFFQISGYMWILVWYFVFMTEFLVVKHKVDTVDMTNWVCNSVLHDRLVLVNIDTIGI